MYELIMTNGKTNLKLLKICGLESISSLILLKSVTKCGGINLISEEVSFEALARYRKLTIPFRNVSPSKTTSFASLIEKRVFLPSPFD